MAYNANLNILSQRYASPRMNEIFSEEGKTKAERDLWIAVMKAQRELGVDIPAEDIERFERARDGVNLARIEEIEKRTRHDVKAKIEAFVEAAGAGQHIHRAMTSRDLTDNVEQMQALRAMKLAFGKYVSVMRHMIKKADEYTPVVMTARTHHQPAQPTLLGRRFSMWAEELHNHLLQFEDFIESYPLRGIKGPVGTQFDMLTLLGSAQKVEELEQRVAAELGFSRVLSSPGQVYPRSLDQSVVSRLSELSAACQSYATTMRLMAGGELVTEGFREGQVGSSAMPHKMNTRSSERIVGFAKLLKMYAAGAAMNAGDQWEEGDVSCSVVRRVIIPDAFYASDGLAETALTVLNEMGDYPAVIDREADRYLPFLATTEFLNVAVKAGIGREDAHRIIKTYAIGEALKMRQEGAGANSLAEKLSECPKFAEAGISREQLDEILSNRAHFVGRAVSQINDVKTKAEPMIRAYRDQAAYEPGDIL